MVKKNKKINRGRTKEKKLPTKNSTTSSVASMPEKIPDDESVIAPSPMRDTINPNTDHSIAKKPVSLKNPGDEEMDSKMPAIGKDIIYDVANFTETSIEDE